jgi:hypothetical protein
VSVLFPQSLPPWTGFCRSDSRSGFPQSMCSLQIFPFSLVLDPLLWIRIVGGKDCPPLSSYSIYLYHHLAVVLRDTSSFRPNIGLLLFFLSLFLPVSICLYSTIQIISPSKSRNGEPSTCHWHTVRVWHRVDRGNEVVEKLLFVTTLIHASSAWKRSRGSGEAG